MNRWKLTPEARERFIPKIMEMIEKIEARSSEDVLEFDLSDTELNPYTLCSLLKELWYEQGDQDENGWQFDFWIPFTKTDHKDIQVKGTGMTFELFLAEGCLGKYMPY